VALAFFKGENMRDLKELRLRDFRTIDDIYGNHPFMRVVEHDASGAISDLRKYDDTFFVLYNKVSNTFEVHNVENVGSTYCFSMPALDGRVVLEARRSDTRNRSIKDLMAEIDKNNEELEKSNRRAFLTECEGRAEEIFPYFRDAFSDVIVGSRPNKGASDEA